MRKPEELGNENTFREYKSKMSTQWFKAATRKRENGSKVSRTKNP